MFIDFGFTEAADFALTPLRPSHTRRCLGVESRFVYENCSRFRRDSGALRPARVSVESFASIITFLQVDDNSHCMIAGLALASSSRTHAASRYDFHADGFFLNIYTNINGKRVLSNISTRDHYSFNRQCLQHPRAGSSLQYLRCFRQQVSLPSKAFGTENTLLGLSFTTSWATVLLLCLCQNA